ncbi:MAG: nickel/cobalt transporter [Alphaproteobacteria bacterium]
MRIFAFLLSLLTFVLLAAPAQAQTTSPNHDANTAVSASSTAPNAAAQKTPAAAPPAAKTRNPFGVKTAPQTSSGGSSSFWLMITSAQRTLHKKMTAELRALQGGDTMSAALFLIAISFIYGVIHAAGPGHGKAVISSYMLANKTTLRRGITIAVLAALVQACSAVALIGVLVMIMKSTGLEIRHVTHRIEMISALLITAAGLYFLTVHMRRQYFASASGAAVGDLENGSCIVTPEDIPDPRMLEKKLVLREVIAIIFAVGIRPCTGAIVVLLFSMRLNMLWAGIVSAFIMAIGTSITVSSLAVLAVSSRDVAARLAGSRWTDSFYNFATFAGCLLVTVVGLGLFWHSLGPVQPF